LLDPSTISFSVDDVKPSSRLSGTAFVDYECLEVGEATYKLLLTFSLDVETTPGNFETFVFEHEVEKTIECVDPDAPVTPPPTPEFPPDVSIDTGTGLDFTHICDQTPCPQEIGNIVLTNNSNINSASVSLLSSNQSTLGFIEAPVPPNVTENDISNTMDIEIEPGESISIVVFYLCDREESFSEIIFIDGFVIDSDGKPIGETAFAEDVIVNGTLIKNPPEEPEIQEGTYQSTGGNCAIPGFDLKRISDLIISLDKFGDNPDGLQFNHGGPLRYDSQSSNIIIQGQGGHSCSLIFGALNILAPLLECSRPGAFCSQSYLHSGN